MERASSALAEVRFSPIADVKADVRFPPTTDIRIGPLRGARTPNLRVWNPTRYHCAMESLLYILIRGSIVVSIPACHAGNPGSIPGLGAFFFNFYFFFKKKDKKKKKKERKKKKRKKKKKKKRNKKKKG